jgi:cytochrome c peroxidase
MSPSATLKSQIVIVLGFLLTIIARANDSTRFDLKLPLGVPAELWEYYIPKDNPMTPAKVELGRQLFFDKRLSADGTVSCATCHDPQRAFSDGKKVAEGIRGRRGTINAPTVLNAMFNSGQFWDGRVESLEAQAKLPLINPDEMGNESHEQVVARLQAIPDYVKQFREVFANPVTIDGVAQAIAAFERTLVSANSPFDRFSAGDANALGAAAQRGLALFRGKARCNVCHNINQAFPFLTDQQYRNTGVAANDPAFESLSQKASQLAKTGLTAARLETLSRQPGATSLGRFLSTGNVLDIGAFKTPSLRDIELTAPYFHDGSADTLADVLRFYTRGGNLNRYRDWQLEPVNLTESEQSDLIEFLKSLTSDDARRLYCARLQM